MVLKQWELSSPWVVKTSSGALRLTDKTISPNSLTQLCQMLKWVAKNVIDEINIPKDL